MATPTIVTAGAVVSATRKYSNKDSADRDFDISADVNIANSKVSSFNNGTLLVKENPTNGSANFSRGADASYLSFNSSNLTDSEARKAFEAVIDFVEAVIEKVNSTEV